MSDVLILPSARWHRRRLVEERTASRIRGRHKSAVLVSSTEVLFLSEDFPELDDVTVYNGWFSAFGRPLTLLSAFANAATRNSWSGLDVDIDAARTTAHLANDAGRTDLALSVVTSAQTLYRSGERVSTLTSYTSTDGAWYSTLSRTNVLSSGTVRVPRDVTLQVGEGRMADDLRSLRPIRTVRLDVMTEGQLALHMPVPTSVQSQS